MYMIRLLAALFLAAVLSACGGGGGSPGTTGTGTGGGIGSTPSTGTATAQVSNFYLLLDRSTLPNTGVATAKVTAVAVDSKNNVVPGATVSISSDSNSVFAPNGTTTDATGQYTGQLGIGADKSDRQVLVTAVINGITKQTSVQVYGTQLKVQATPAAPAPGQSVKLTVTAVDAAANPIPGVVITMGGSIASILNQHVTTGPNGVATLTFNAPSAAGAYTINASGNGATSGDYQVQVFTSVVPHAVVPPGAQPSLSASPNVLATNSPGSTTNRSTLRLLFLDPTNTPISNVRVRFVDMTTGLPAVNASITSGTSTLFTDASGSVSADYVSGPNPSPTNGVTVRACWSDVDFTSSTDCPNHVDATLTVAGQALAVSIGDDNVLSKGQGTYIKRFAVTVADSAGRAVANAPVDISVDLTHFGKGPYSGVIGGIPPNVPAQASPSDPSASLSGTDIRYSVVPSATQRVWCANEDLNRNGSVDPNENLDGSIDSNGQPTLEPRKSDLLISYDDPAVTRTNADGILVIKVEYSQRFATWLAYKVRVTANVSGSQGMAERLFVTSFVEGDDKNGSFLQPPYGVNACQIPN